MRKVFSLVLLSVVCLSAIGCSDAFRGKIGAYGNSAHVEVYSGGEKIYDGYSTGKVISEANSDGYFFVDKADGKTKEVSGNVVITYEK